MAADLELDMPVLQKRPRLLIPGHTDGSGDEQVKNNLGVVMIWPRFIYI